MITTDMIECPLLYLSMIILYKASSDWFRMSRDRANKIRISRGRNSPPPRKFRGFSSQKNEKADISIR